MFFNSIKEINRLKKELNRLLSKGMSNIFLKVTIETFSKLRLQGFEKFVTGSVFGELQLMKISLSLKLLVGTEKSQIWEENRVTFLLL